MKSLSASVIVLSGAIVFSAGAHVAHSDTQMFVMLVGAAIGLMGITAWAKAKD